MPDTSNRELKIRLTMIIGGGAAILYGCVQGIWWLICIGVLLALGGIDG